MLNQYLYDCFIFFLMISSSPASEVAVIIGGTGNNYGSIIGGFLVWFLWVEAEPLGLFFVEILTSPLNDRNPLKMQLLTNAAHMRYIMMGLLLLLVLRFSPKGIFPEGR